MVVFSIWTRLVEDVVLFQTVEPYNRRKDLQNAITYHIPKLLNVTETYLEKNTKLPGNGNGNGNVTEMFGEDLGKNLNEQKSSSVIFKILPALEFASSVLEWIPAKSMAETKIVEIVTKFLICPFDELRQKAAEVLWRLTERKGKSEERIPVMQLFEMDVMQIILLAAK